MSDPFLGEIRNFAFSFPPYGWAQCQGQLLPVTQNQALFSLLGTTYGGNGTTTFGLPDLRGRAPIGLGQGPGLSNITQGELAGAEQVTLTIPQIPSHTHIATFTPSGGGGTVNVTIQAGNQAAAATVPATPYLAATSYLARGTGPGQYASSAGATPSNLGGVSATISGVSGGTVTNANTGGSLPVPIRDPYLGSNYCIALQGVFPTRG